MKTLDNGTHFPSFFYSPLAEGSFFKLLIETRKKTSPHFHMYNISATAENQMGKMKTVDNYLGEHFLLGTAVFSMLGTAVFSMLGTSAFSMLGTSAFSMLETPVFPWWEHLLFPGCEQMLFPWCVNLQFPCCYVQLIFPCWGQLQFRCCYN